MINKIIGCLVICALLVSCKKERTIHITAKNAVTGQPYAGLTYYVVQKKTGYDGEEFKTMATGTLNADGEAFLTMKLKKAHAYGVRVEEPSNTCYFNELAFHFGNQESNFDAHFEYAECAYLKLKIENVNCEGADDNFKLYHEGSDVGFNNYGGGSPIREGDGCYYFEPSHFSNVPIGRRFYKWEVTRSGITETFFDTIYLIENEYKTYEINY